MRAASIVVAGLVVFGACGESSPGVPAQAPSPEATAPAVLSVVCEADGSTVLGNDEVSASPDGVHIEVDNRAGEFVSLNGTGQDFSEGITEQAAAIAPGEVRVACWPGSMHTGPEPRRFPVQVLDPEGFYSAAELECPDGSLVASVTNDFASFEHGRKGDPVDLAADDVNLGEDDETFAIGYPEAEFRSVGVRREGKVIAILGYSPTDDGGWLLGGYQSCDSARIRT